MPGLTLGVFKAELRVYHPELNEVTFVRMPGHNFGECVNKAANKWPGWVVTDAASEIFVGDDGKHHWSADNSLCVNCGVFEWMAVDDDCSGIHGLF